MADMLGARPNPSKVLFPNDVVFRSDHFAIAQDWEVPIPGFYILSSVQPRRSIIEFDDQEIIELVHLQRLIRRSMMDVLNIVDVYFFQNEDSECGFHIWIFPRHPWMDRFGRKIQSVRPIMEYAVASMANDFVFSQIREANQKIKSYMSQAHRIKARYEGCRERLL